MPTRGILADGDGPLDADDLADKTSFPVEIFEIALEVLVDPKFGWLEILENGVVVVPATGTSPGDLGPSPGEAEFLPGEEGPETGEPEGQHRLVGAGSAQSFKKKQSPTDVEMDLPFHGPEFVKEWSDYEKHRIQLRKKLTPVARHRLFLQFETWGEQKTILAIKWSLQNGWTGIFEPRIPGAGIQAPMFQAEGETENQRQLRINCRRCNGTCTELVPGKGARPCDHLSTEDIE